MIAIIDDDVFEEFAISNYNNPNCVSVLEFLDDLKKIRYVKRLINKYRDRGELRERLILNHIIFLSNVFGVKATVEMLRYKIEDANVDILNSFLIYLNYCDTLVNYNEELLITLRKKI
jgi:hypothetical protein